MLHASLTGPRRHGAMCLPGRDSGRHVRRSCAGASVAGRPQLPTWNGLRHGELPKRPRGPVRRRGGCSNVDKQFASHAAKPASEQIRRGHHASDEPGSTKMAHSGFASSRIWSRWWRRRSTRTVRESGSGSSTSISALSLDRSLTDPSLLLEDEVAWIDAFHSQCWATVAPLLTHQNLDDAAGARSASAGLRLWQRDAAFTRVCASPVPPPNHPAKCTSCTLGARAVVVVVVVLSVIHTLSVGSGALGKGYRPHFHFLCPYRDSRRRVAAAHHPVCSSSRVACKPRPIRSPTPSHSVKMC